jgi:hypothetical protein
MKPHLVALAVLCLSCAYRAAAPTPAARPPTFLENDYPRALEQARARGVPLFVDTGPLWSHFSRWMRAYVFTDPALARHADRFVWLSLDTERPENAAFFAKFTVNHWIALLIVEPRTETALAQWDGQASVQELELLFETAELARSGRATGLEASLLAADKLFADKRYTEAAAAYRQLVDEASLGWRHRWRAISSALSATSSAAAQAGGGEQSLECARLAEQYLPSVSALEVALLANFGLEYALDAPKEAPSRQELIAVFEPLVREAAVSPPAGLAAIDRSQMYRHMVRAREDAGDAAGAKEAARQWVPLLDELAARAPTPQARAVFDIHRFIAYLTLEQPERAVLAFEASERDMPWDYNPPAYLAGLYRRLKQLDRALAASDRALAKAYGAQRGRLLLGRAEILLASGQRELARQAIEEGIAYVRGLEPAQVPAWVMPPLEKRLKELQ